MPTRFGNFGPRLGFAYSVNPKTVVRGAYGIFYVQGGASGGGGETLGTNQSGYVATPSFGSLDGGISPAFNWNAGLPAYTHAPFFESTLSTGSNTTNPSPGGIASYGQYSQASRAPYSQNWNLTVERSVASDTTVSVSYSASVSHFLPTLVRIGIYSDQIEPGYLALGNLLLVPATPGNIAAAQAIIPGVHLPSANYAGTNGQMLKPFPQYVGINDVYPLGGNGAHHSLEVAAQKRYSNGLSFLLSYTFHRQLMMQFVYSPNTLFGVLRLVEALCQSLA